MTSNDGPYSLIEILKNRYDTVFRGEELDSYLDIPPYEPREFIIDNRSNKFTQPHDHIEVVEEDLSCIAIFVADENGRHSFDHEFSDLPHGMGLFVRGEHRGQGIATELVHNFMETVDEDTIVIHCNDDLKPFYEQLDCDVIYL